VRVLICPDKFAGTLTAVEAADAIARGWHEAAPDDELIVRPIADGGPGFLDVLAPVVPGVRVDVSTVGPLGEPAPGWVLVAGDRAYVESAQACGLHLVPPSLRDPRQTTSYGLGALVATAVEAGVREVVIGLGGSATNDGGAGLLAALGAPPVDEAGFALPYGGAALAFCHGLGGVPSLRNAVLIGASDVDSPLVGPLGASAVYGPQKGARPEDVALLDAALARYATVLERDLPGCPPGLAARPGAGAAGGLGAAILALGGRLESGFGLVRQATGLDAEFDACDLVITGEGSFDVQSLRGKVVGGVAAAARDRHVPCVVMAGRASAPTEDARAAGISTTYSLVDHFGDVATALARPADGLHALAAHHARTPR
jgi:glycerate 2-kinase